MSNQAPLTVCQMSDCSNPTVLDSVLCAHCMASGPPVTVDGILNARRPDPIPTEEQEEYARTMRCTYLALIGQGFTEDQALRIVGDIIKGMFQ